MTYFAFSSGLARTATDWFHGTGNPKPFSRFDFGKSHAEFDQDDSDHHRQWNSRLGGHFSTEHQVASELGQSSGEGHVYHVGLNMKNPKHYRSEFDLGQEAHAWARHHEGYTDLGMPHAGRSAWDEALTDHPNAQHIADGFRAHLQSQGHDGITYGNEYEGTQGHKSAIAFHPDQVSITHSHGAYEPCDEASECHDCGTLVHRDESRCPECHEPVGHNVTAHFRQAAKAKDFDWSTAQHYLAETAFTKNHEQRHYADLGEAQEHAHRIAKAEGISSPSIIERHGGPGSVYWHSGRYGDSGPEIGLKPDHMHEAALIHEMTHHFRHETGQSEGHDPGFSRNYGAMLWDHHSRTDGARAEFKHYHQAADEMMRANPEHYPAPPEDGEEAPAHTATAFFKQATQQSGHLCLTGHPELESIIAKAVTTSDNPADGYSPHQRAVYSAQNEMDRAHLTSPDKIVRPIGEIEGHIREALQGADHPDADRVKVGFNNKLHKGQYYSFAKLPKRGAPSVHLGLTGLNPHTAMHEAAHLVAWHKHGSLDDDHGPEFVDAFRQLLHDNGHHEALATFDKHYEGPEGASPKGNPHTATAFFAQAATDGYTPTTQKEGDHGNDEPRSAAGDHAPRGHAGRPAPRQPESASLRRREASAEVERHPELQGDLDRLGGGARHVQDTISALHQGGSGVTTYPLSHPLDGWHAAFTNGGHQVVHRHDPETGALHVGYAGHNISEAEQRLGATESESKSLPVDFHGGAEKDFDKLHPEVQDKVLNTIDRLSRGEAHPHDHNLAPSMPEWRSARADFLHRVTHRYEDEHGNPTSHEKASRLFIGHVGPHNYEAAEKRLSSLTEFFKQAAEGDTPEGTLARGMNVSLSHTVDKHAGRTVGTVQQTAGVSDDEYHMMHKAPDAHGAPLHDPTNPPKGGYGAFSQEDLDHPDWGSIGEPHEESLHAVNRAKGRPDAPVTIYRAAPHGTNKINTGDWVSTSAEYALGHAVQDNDSSHDWPVYKATVPAKHVRTDGNDINEWAYHGPAVHNPAVHGPDEAWTNPEEHGHRTAARTPYTEDTSDDRPVTFDYHRRTTPAPQVPASVHYHGQDNEPHGRYVSQGRSAVDLPDLESGTLTFQRPLRLHSPTDDPAHPDHWKQQLVRRYNGAKGADLSQAIRDDGYDGIMTHDSYGPSETVDLTHLTPRTATVSFQQMQAEAAAVDHSDGVMIAFVPPREVAEQLAREGGQPVEDLHVTLAYLGSVSDYTPEQLKLLPQVVSSWAIRQKPVSLRIGGTGKFNNPAEGQHVLYASVDIPGGAQLHADLARYLQGHGYKLPSEHGWTPHLTLAYVDRHFRFMPHLDEHRWTAEYVVTEVGRTRHQARLGTIPSGRHAL